MHTLIELEKLTTEWADARGIIKNGNMVTQGLKLFEEAGELAGAILKGQDKKIKDGIGDSLVVLNNIAKIYGTTLVECWNLAYEEIKDRKGYLNEDGNFIKEADIPNINELTIISTASRLNQGIPFTLDIHIVYSNKTDEILTVAYNSRSPISVPTGKGLTLAQYKKLLQGFNYGLI